MVSSLFLLSELTYQIIDCREITYYNDCIANWLKYIVSPTPSIIDGVVFDRISTSMCTFSYSQLAFHM